MEESEKLEERGGRELENGRGMRENVMRKGWGRKKESRTRTEESGEEEMRVMDDMGSWICGIRSPLFTCDTAFRLP